MQGGQRSIAILAGLLAVALTLAVLHNSGASVPIEGFVVRVTGPIRDALSGAASRVSGLLGDVGRINALRDENVALQRRVEELETTIAASGNAKRENAILREALAYARAHADLDLLTARVVGRDSVGVLNTLVIDRGASAGVRVGMAVVAQGGLVGRVTGVSDASADVLPLLDAASSVNVVASGPRASADGIVAGAGNGTLVMQRIEPVAGLGIGDLVVTSGLGGGFPPGIPVGRIVNLQSSPASVFREARVAPYVAGENLEIVQVVLGQRASS